MSVSVHGLVAEIRLDPIYFSKSLQPSTPLRNSPNIQGTPQPVAARLAQFECPLKMGQVGQLRRVRIGLTAPFQACLEDHLIIVCGASHPLAAQVAIKPEALGQAKWLLNRVGSVARDQFETLSQRHDWPLSARCLITMHIPELTRDMLLTQEYLAIVPKSVALPWLASSEILELDLGMAAPLKQLSLIYPAYPKGKAIKTFADFFIGGKG